MAIQNGDAPGKRNVKTTATGNAADTGTPVSIPPTKQPPDYAKDFTWGRTGYGANAFGGASSDTPGKRTRGNMSVNNDDTDPVLSALRLHGSAAMRSPEVGDDVEDVRGTPATQIRDVSAANKTPIHPAMVGSNAARQPTYPGPKATIPGALTDDEAQPVRSPGK